MESDFGMTRNPIFALAVLALLGACGVDGEPVQPTMNAGIMLSGSGMNTSGSVGVQQGPISLFFGF